MFTDHFSGAARVIKRESVNKYVSEYIQTKNAHSGQQKPNLRLRKEDAKEIRRPAGNSGF